MGSAPIAGPESFEIWTHWLDSAGNIHASNSFYFFLRISQNTLQSLPEFCKGKINTVWCVFINWHNHFPEKSYSTSSFRKGINNLPDEQPQCWRRDLGHFVDNSPKFDLNVSLWKNHALHLLRRNLLRVWPLHFPTSHLR